MGVDAVRCDGTLKGTSLWLAVPPISGYQKELLDLVEAVVHLG